MTIGRVKWSQQAVTFLFVTILPLKRHQLLLLRLIFRPIKAYREIN